MGHKPQVFLLAHSIIDNPGTGFSLNGFPGGSNDKESACKTQVGSLGQKDPLEKEKATHSSILAWRIPWTKDPGGLQSRGHRVGYD